MTPSFGNLQEALSGLCFSPAIDLHQLGKDEQDFINSRLQSIKIKKKAPVYRMHEKPKGVYFIRKGKVKVTQTNYDGGTQILFIYTVGEAFGFRPLIANELQPVNAIALEDCELDFLPAADFLQLLHSSATLANMFLKSLSHEFTVLVNRINLFAQKGIKERLAFALLVLNEKYKHANALVPRADVTLSRTDLANYVGTSLENLVRTIQVFKDRKLIATRGKSISIIHFQSLLILSGIQ